MRRTENEDELIAVVGALALREDGGGTIEEVEDKHEAAETAEGVQRLPPL